MHKTEYSEIFRKFTWLYNDIIIVCELFRQDMTESEIMLKLYEILTKQYL